MKLIEIIEDIDLLVPNAFSYAKKIGWINQAQRQLFHDYPNFIAKKEIPVIMGQTEYALPLDCQQSNIEVVMVDGFEYIYSEVKERPEYRSYTLLDGLIIHPVPSTAGTLTIYYKPTPVDLTSADTEKPPVIPEDFHELLVYGCGFRVAQRTQDYKIATELEVRYQNLAREAAKRNTKPKRKTTVIHRGWS